MSAIRHDFARLSSGVRLHYAEQGNPEGDPVLCLHGWPDSWFTFSRMLHFVPERFTLCEYAETGHCPNWERPEKTAADLVEFVEDRCATIL
jgi:hypothetical protein